MAISTVYIYYVANQQLANRQYVLQPSSTLLTTNNNIKNTGDFYQEIHIPYSASNATANMMKIDNKYYDILEVDNTTFKESSTVYKIALNPISTYITNGLTVTGMWDRTPTAINKGVKINMTTDAYKPSRSVILPYEGPKWGYEDKAFYVEISTRAGFNPGFNSSSTNTWIKGIAGTTRRYGFFVPFNIDNLVDNTTGWYHVNDGSTLYPSLMQIMSVVTDVVLDEGSDTIASVAISPRCPWKYRITNVGGYPVQFDIMTGTTAIASTTMKGGYDGIMLNGSGADNNEAWSTSTELVLSDYERYCGRVIVEDELGNDIAEIPTEIFSGTNSLSYYCYAVSDISGIYTVIRYNDKEIVIPEGQLPWLGNNWKDYMATTQSYDREMLKNSIDRTYDQAELDKRNAIANGVMNATYTGMMGGMSGKGATGAAIGAGMAIASTAITYDTLSKQAKLDVNYLKADLAAKEGLIKQSSPSNYQLGSGLNYLISSCTLGGAKIRIDLPANGSSSEFTNYVSYRGYPCNKYASFSLSAGYIKGNIHSLPTTVGSGYAMNMLRKEIAEGCRILTS